MRPAARPNENTWLRRRGHAKDDDHASNDTPAPTFPEVLLQEEEIVNAALALSRAR